MKKCIILTSILVVALAFTACNNMLLQIKHSLHIKPRHQKKKAIQKMLLWKKLKS